MADDGTGPGTLIGRTRGQHAVAACRHEIVYQSDAVATGEPGIAKRCGPGVAASE